MGATAKSTSIYSTNSYGTADASDTDFQPHHQPFNYYANLDPASHSAARATHLKDRAESHAGDRVRPGYADGSRRMAKATCAGHIRFRRYALATSFSTPR